MCVPFCNMMGVRALRTSKLGLGALCNLFWPPPHCFTHTAPSLVSHSTISQGTKRGAERQRRLQPTLAPTPKRSRKRLKSALTSLLVTSQRPLKAGRQPRPSLLPFARGWPRSKPSLRWLRLPRRRANHFRRSLPGRVLRRLDWQAHLRLQHPHHRPTAWHREVLHPHPHRRFRQGWEDHHRHHRRRRRRLAWAALLPHRHRLAWVDHHLRQG
jgi:hypothetical protein